MLAFSDERGPLPQRALSDALDLDPSATVAVLDGLERAGYLEGRPDPSDRRVRLIALTGRGREFLARCKRQVHLATARLVSDLPPSERLQLEALLRRVLLANEPEALPTPQDGAA